jgi:hypothetical protein
MPEQVSSRRALGARGIRAIKLASGSWIILNSIDSALRDQVDDAPLRIGTTFDVALCRCQARMTGQLLNVTKPPAALDPPFGSLGDESATPAMAGCALEAQIAIQRQKPDRESFWRNADIAFAENDPIFRRAWFERLELDESLSQIFGCFRYLSTDIARTRQPRPGIVGADARLLPR